MDRHIVHKKLRQNNDGQCQTQYCLIPPVVCTIKLHVKIV